MLKEIEMNYIKFFIKKVIIITLPFRKDRLSNICNELLKLSIKKDDYDQEYLKYIEGVKFPYAGYISGRCGCSAAHTKALQFAYNNNLDNVLILEDDCFFVDDKLESIYLALKDLENINWDLLYIGSRIKEKMIDFSQNLYRINKWGCGHATLYNRRAIKYILDLMPHWGSNYNVWLDWVNKNECQDVYLPRILGNKEDIFVFHTKELCALQVANHSNINNKFADGREILENDFNKYKP